MANKEASRIVRVSLIQPGPMTNNKAKNIKDFLRKVEEVAEKEHPDFLMGAELSLTPYFCSVCDERYFDLAEPIPGPVTELFGEKTKKYKICLLLSIFERASIEGVYYNSVVVLGPEGNIIEGIMPDGTKVRSYAKNHIPYRPSDPSNYNERFYFKEGIGYPVFETPKARIGIATCFDRYFPEDLAVLGRQGVEIIFSPGACWQGLLPERGASAEEMYMPVLRTRALENSAWVCATNKVGAENVHGKVTTFFGMSSIIHPTGQVVVQALRAEPAVITYDLDLEDVSIARRFFPIHCLLESESR
jgi:N-carbamoylputrescine amidase